MKCSFLNGKREYCGYLERKLVLGASGDSSCCGYPWINDAGVF